MRDLWKRWDGTAGGREVSVRFIVTDNPDNGSDRVALYDSVSGWAFGPVFDSVEAARVFLNWLPEDARSYSNGELGDLYSRFVDEKKVPA